MTPRPEIEHLSAAGLQAFLEGELPSGDLARVEEHLASCARCAARLEAWRGLFDELAAMPRLVPHEGFADRVMAGVERPAALPWAARVRARAASLVGGGDMVLHPGAGGLQDFVEGLLSRRHAARVARHLDGCAACAGEVAEWRKLLGRLDGLERFGPGRDFAAAVMRGVALPAPATVASRRPLAARVAAFGRRLAPDPRRAWAAISGVAVTPMATLGLVLYAVFSHPTLTPGALVSFAWWKITDAATALLDGAAATALESAGVFRVWSALDAMVQAPAMVAGGLLTFSILTVAALWVLYRNLFATRAADGRYAHATL